MSNLPSRGTPRLRASPWVAALCLSASCSDASPSAAEFRRPFQVSELEERLSLDGPVGFSIVDSVGDPVPHGLLRVVWDDGPRVSIQANEAGCVVMQLEQSLVQEDPELWADRMAPGPMLEHDYEHATTTHEGTIVVTRHEGGRP